MFWARMTALVRTCPVVLAFFLLLPIATAGTRVLEFAWAGQLAADASPGDVAVDASGNVYTVGNFSGTVDFDPNPAHGTFNLTSAGGRDAFISKLDAAGNFVWAKRLGGGGSDGGFGLVLDGVGNGIIDQNTAQAAVIGGMHTRTEFGGALRFPVLS